MTEGALKSLRQDLEYQLKRWEDCPFSFEDHVMSLFDEIERLNQEIKVLQSQLSMDTPLKG